jgi:hypothetical protein
MTSVEPPRSQLETNFMIGNYAETLNIRNQAAKHIINQFVQQHIGANAPIFSIPSSEDETFALDEDEDEDEKQDKDEGDPASRVGGKICIIGAGVAGLYTAMIFDSLGIDYDILEANPDRVGGRLFTYRFNGKAGRDAPVNDPKRYDYIGE